MVKSLFLKKSDIMAKTTKKAPAKKGPAKKGPANSAPAPKSKQLVQRIARPDPDGFKRKFHRTETMSNGAIRSYFYNAEGVECYKLTPAKSPQAKVTQKIGPDGRRQLVK